MVYCVVAECQSNSVATKTRPKFDGSFHQLPEDDAERRRLWIRRINRRDGPWREFLAQESAEGPKTRKFVCSRHFKDEDFVISKEMAERMGFGAGKIDLKQDAVPSINMGKPETAEPQTKRPRLAAVKLDLRRVSDLYTQTFGMSLRLFSITWHADIIPPSPISIQSYLFTEDGNNQVGAAAGRGKSRGRWGECSGGRWTPSNIPTNCQHWPNTYWPPDADYAHLRK